MLRLASVVFALFALYVSPSSLQGTEELGVLKSLDPNPGQLASDGVVSAARRYLHTNPESEGFGECCCRLKGNAQCQVCELSLTQRLTEDAARGAAPLKTQGRGGWT